MCPSLESTRLVAKISSVAAGHHFPGISLLKDVRNADSRFTPRTPSLLNFFQWVKCLPFREQREETSCFAPWDKESVDTLIYTARLAELC